MGYDIGYHAIDKNDIDEMSAYILGKTDALTYLPAAITASRSRFIANAWGLGVSQWGNAKSDEQRKKIKKEIEKSKPSFIGKLLGKKAKKDDYSWLDQSPYVGDFNKDLHIWGRPFLIVDTNNIENLIKAYLSGQEVDEIALGQIQLIKQGLAELVKPDGVELPKDEQFGENSRWKVDFFRKAYLALLDGTTVQGPDGDELEPGALFAGDLHFSLVETAAIKQPTWMARGYVWPSLLLGNAGADLSFFQTASILLNKLESKLSDIQYNFATTITENYTLGGVVSPANMPAFKQALTEYSRKILSRAEDEDWGEECTLVLQKINECVDYCINNKLYFVESSDIYSGVLGTIC